MIIRRHKEQAAQEAKQVEVVVEAPKAKEEQPKKKPAAKKAEPKENE